MKTTAALLLALAAGANIATAAEPDPDGQALVDVIARRDAAAFDARFDPDAMLERVLAGAAIPDGARDGFATGFRRAAAQAGRQLLRNAESSHIVPTLVKSTRDAAGSIQLVRFAMHDAQGDAAGYDYIEFDLGPDGRVRDWRSHVQGSWASDTMRLLSANIFEETSLLDKLFGRATANNEALAAIEELATALKHQDFRAAHEALAKLPEEFRKTREWACLRSALSSMYDEKTYRADLDVVAAQHGADPEVQFMLVDYFFYRQEYEPMVRAIRRFEQRVVADGATKQIECTGDLLLGRYTDAEAACREGMRIEPAFEHGWWTLVDVYARKHDAPKLLATIDAIEPRFHKHMRPDKLITAEGYEWLAQDATFKAWAQKRH